MLVVITANSGVPRILLTMYMISKTVTGIISDRIATLKYLISVFSKAMGYKPMDFVNAYRDNRKKQNVSDRI